MLFKLEGGSLAQRPKKLGDSKLMIYDILK
jgi:hypothetical protein